MIAQRHKIAFATSCDLNYIAQAHVLAESVKEIYPDASFFLGLNESSLDLSTEVQKLTSCFDFVYTGTNLHQHYVNLEKRYGVIELCCSTKPALLKHCFEQGFDTVIYMDPDTLLLSPLDEVFDFFKSRDAEAIFTPPISRLWNLEMEVSSMKHGILNLGFLGLKRSDGVLDFLSWWNTRLETMCIRDPHRGIFTDQTWAGLALGVLNSKIIRNSGYNFATWNLADHKVIPKNRKLYIDESPLVFAHFSTFSVGGIEKFIKKYKVDPSKAFYKLLDNYRSSVNASALILDSVIHKKAVKAHYKKRRFYNKSRIELKILFIDQLHVRSPRTLKVLMWIKRRI